MYTTFVNIKKLKRVFVKQAKKHILLLKLRQAQKNVLFDILKTSLSTYILFLFRFDNFVL